MINELNDDQLNCGNYNLFHLQIPKKGKNVKVSRTNRRTDRQSNVKSRVHAAEKRNSSMWLCLFRGFWKSQSRLLASFNRSSKKHSDHLYLLACSPASLPASLPACHACLIQSLTPRFRETVQNCIVQKRLWYLSITL